ncbi:nucleoporin Nup85-like protein [Gongronella butleri]|nr:nucleoporin Nup85-like protein [Gongronella butleri]
MDIQLGFNDDHIDDPGDEQLTWPRLHQQLRRGNTLDVAERLKWFMTTDQCKTPDAYSSLIEVLEMIPALPMTMEETAQWNEQWPEWHDKALVTFDYFYGDQGSLRDAHDLDDIGLRESFEVLSEPHYAGDFNLVDSYLPSLIYSHPTVLDLDTRRRCVEALQECCKTGGNDNDDDDAVYAALFSSRLDNFMGLIDRDAWLATHLGHLLLLAGHLEYDTHKDTEPSLTERPVDPIFHTLNDYARQLATEYGMLKEAMQYNMVCTVNSNCWNIELLEDHSRVSWSDHAMKSIAQFCRENKQDLVESYIYTQLGNRALDQDKHDVAAKHYATAKNIEGLENVAEILLTQYLMDGQLDHVVMADKQADALEAAPTYRFLRVYKQFRDLVQSKQFDQAYALIGPLATMEHAMADFSGVVLVDAFDVYAGKCHQTQQKASLY